MRERDLRLALAEGWQIGAMTLRYAAVGGGSYHWVVRDEDARRWFVTVDDLDDKPWLGETRTAVLAGLQAAMDTAVALRRDAGLPFVVAPVPGPGGQTTRRVDAQYAVAVFRFVSGIPGRFGADLSGRERTALVDILAALHQSTHFARRAAVSRIGLPRRTDLEEALDELGRPWRAGPFAEPARALLTGAEPRIRERLAAFDRLAEAARAAEPVITHGEPHPGNIMRTDTTRVLIDWDTVGLGPPERDLWLVTDGAGGEEWRRYAMLTGRAVDHDLLAFYRLRWALDDLSAFLHRLRGAHRRTADAEHALLSLKETAVRLGRVTVGP
jgi:spectinomycin phosphotransferase